MVLLLAPVVELQERIFYNATSNAVRGIENNSQAILYLTKNLSNSILAGSGSSGLARATSQALLYLIKNLSNTELRFFTNNSNAIVAGAGGGSALAKATSQALLYLIKNVSNTELRLFQNNSQAILANATCCRVNSNALLYLIKNVSNTELRLNQNNSNAIVLLAANAQGNLIIGGPEFTMHRNYVVSVDSTVSVTGNTTLNGNGHVFDFANQTGNFTILPNINLLLTNVVLRNYLDGGITLGSGSSVVFGNGTVVEFFDMQSLSNNMTFSGQSEIQGFGNKLMMNNAVISVNPGGILTLENLYITGLKNYNIRAQGRSASVKFKNATLCVSNNYSFSTGRILFDMDVYMVGTNTFGYRPTNAGSGILSSSRLVLDVGLTFSYAPVAANRLLLGMTDQSSILYMNGCTLESTTTGMQLINGTLIIDHKNEFFNPGATSASQAIAFGNGTPANDLNVQMLPGGRIQLQSGQLANP